jgi:hypothetical protein
MQIIIGVTPEGKVWFYCYEANKFLSLDTEYPCKKDLVNDLQFLPDCAIEASKGQPFTLVTFSEYIDQITGSN